MWVLFREQRGANRMYWHGDIDHGWTGDPKCAAAWADRRDPYNLADRLVEARPGPVDAPYTYGEQFIADMPRGRADQIIPRSEQGLHVESRRLTCEAPGCVLPHGHRSAHMTKGVAQERGMG